MGSSTADGFAIGRERRCQSARHGPASRARLSGASSLDAPALSRPVQDACSRCTTMKVGVAREIAPEERRVALVPDAVQKLREAGMVVLVERGAGAAASFPDQSYVEAGAKIVGGDHHCARGSC